MRKKQVAAYVTVPDVNKTGYIQVPMNRKARRAEYKKTGYAWPVYLKPIRKEAK